MNNSAVMRGLVCPVNKTPCVLDVEVGARGTDNAGRLILGMNVNPDGGLLCDDGLGIDPCFVQNHQFKRKYSNSFTTVTTFTRGLI